jgi:glycosyltransferase involved in cell wall biosynthesis
MNFPEDYPSLIFEGNMSFLPSVDAMIYFCRDVFPLITAKAPEAKLWIVGRDPTSEVRNLHNERIIVTGTVDDVRPYLARASVFICPMRKGAGIKNKLLQAWAMGKPVVATSVGAGGLPAVHQKNVLIADDTHSFAREIICLLADPELRKTLGRNGRQTVLSKYTWDQQARYLQNWMSCH